MCQTESHSLYCQLHFGWRHLIYLADLLLTHALCLHLCLPDEKSHDNIFFQDCFQVELQKGS